MEYDFKAIEQKWQQYWKEHKTYHVEIDNNRPTISVLSIYAAIVERLEIESKRFSAACWIKRC